MVYSDGVPYDKTTMKVKKCPRCGNEEFSDSSDYCRICGTNLFNLCEGEPSYNQKNGEYIGPSNQHKNPSNARFCEKCGKPTVYYKTKILKDFVAVLNPQCEADEAEAEKKNGAAARNGVLPVKRTVNN